jgi:hypothetical protein
MAELLALIFRSAQVAVGLAILAIVFAPVLVWLWPYLWPWLLLFSLIAFYNLLEGIAKRLEGARRLRDDW